MSAIYRLLVALLVLLSFLGGAETPSVTPTPVPPQEAQPPATGEGAAADRPVCPAGGDLALATATGPIAPRCTALPVLQPLQSWDHLDPDPTMPSYSHPEPAQRSRYQLDLQLDPASGQITGTMQLKLVNASSVDLDRLYFHLFPNAPYFTENFSGKMERAGSMTVASVQIDGKDVPFTGATTESLEVRLPAPLASGAPLSLTIRYTAVVPTLEDRYGYDAGTLFLGNAYPLLAMHDQGGWHLDPYVPNGDPFFSEVADYTVSVGVPSGWDVAATGRPAPVSQAGDRSTYGFTAERVRDFALAASAGWSRHERLVDGIQVHYLRDESLSTGAPTPDQVLDTIQGALRFFGAHFGPYPYQDLTVVDRIGMEYPQFVMAGPDLHVVVHEVAHQWWYGIVGNDELRQIWDEGLAEYSALLYEASAGMAPLPAQRRTLTGLAAWPMDDSIYRYVAAGEQGQTSYSQAIYRRGWHFWETLRIQVGDQRFLALIQRFYQRHRFGIATWADWRRVIGEAEPKSLPLFDAWVYGKALPPGSPSEVGPLQP